MSIHEVNRGEEGFYGDSKFIPSNERDLLETAQLTEAHAEAYRELAKARSRLKQAQENQMIDLEKAKESVNVAEAEVNRISALMTEKGARKSTNDSKSGTTDFEIM